MDQGTNDISLELGDIIEIVAPSNPDIHQIVAIIDYIDETKLILIDTENLNRYQLNVDENNMFTDETITEIDLLSRSDEKGYARQNGLLPKTWIDVHFGGEIPATLTGEITNLEEDMIEITTYPDLNVIFIDFAYKGIPQNIPLEKIVIREKPESIKNLGSLTNIKNNVQEEEGEVLEPSVTYNESGESIIKIPEGSIPDSKPAEEIQSDLFGDADAIIFGDKLGVIKQYVELPEYKKRYDIDSQVNNLMDELLSTIPNNQRTIGVLDNLHLLIERFKQLREEFSNFDNNNIIYEAKVNGPFHKPMIDKLEKLNIYLRWFMPIVTNRKKIYNLDVEIDNSDLIQEKIEDVLLAIENSQLDYYKNESQTRTDTYWSVQQKIDNFMTPFENTLIDNNVLISQKTAASMECIVDNLNNFFSTTISENEVSRRRFVIQRYQLGTYKLTEQILKNGKKIYKRAPLTQNDSVSITSFLMLPISVVQYSRIDLPSTNIYERTKLHQEIFSAYRLLRKNTDVVPQVINDLKQEFDYEKVEADSKREFLSDIQEFILHDDNQSDDDKYSKFLDVIVPKTRTFIRLVRKYIRDKLSFRAVVQYLEPFCVYPKDITYQQYNEIRYFVKEKIQKTKVDYVAKRDKISILTSTKYMVNSKLNAVFNLLTEKKELLDALYLSYPFLNGEILRGQISSQETLHRILSLDQGNLQSNLITSLLLCLMTPNDLMDVLKPANIDEMTDVEKIKPEDCYRRFMTKRYDSIAKLKADNNKEEVFYDSEFDETPYDIIKKYKDEQKKMMPDKFFSFLQEVLVQKHDCPEAMAQELAATLIQGKKQIRDGEYAMVEIKPQMGQEVDPNALTEQDNATLKMEADARSKVQYFKRLKNNWLNDKEINENAFLNTNTLFCNIAKDCFKNRSNAICETKDDISKQMDVMNKRKMLDEFDSRYAVNVEELERTLEEALNNDKRFIKNLYFLIDFQSQKANHLAYELGKLSTTNEDLIQSPYLRLRDMILDQSDFSKKQYDIVRFFEKFCREPMIGELEENQHWKYCLETNTKLLPGFLFDLAKEFISGGDYMHRLDEICRAIGKVSQDGDAYVDEHSGYIIRKIDYSNEEGYDDSGFKLVTNAIMEKDLGTIMMEAAGKKEVRVFDNPNSETVYNVFRALCSNIDVQFEGIGDFVLSVTAELMDKVIAKEHVYNARSEKQLKEKGKGLQPYQNYFKEMLILITTSVLFIRIQTAIPSFKTNKTFPGCIRSFSGYPMDGGVEDMTGLKYMSCVVDKTKSKIAPWDAIYKLSQDELVKRMKNIIDAYVLKRSDINELYIQKREYILLNPELISVEEHSVSKWRHFLPPTVNFSVSNTLRNLGDDFNKELLETMRKGHRDQHGQIAILKSRAAYFGFGIIEKINKVVTEKDTLLKTSAQLPFMENACCNENVDVTNPLLYFISEDENIRDNIKAAANMSLLLNNLRELSTASIFFHNEKTGIKYPDSRSGITDHHIYGAIIKYCNFDRNLPVPERLKTIVTERPVGYSSTWSMDEKIEYLKKNGKHYTAESLHQLMRIVAEQNIVTISNKEHFDRIKPVIDIVEALNIENSSIIDEKMRQHLHNVFEQWNPKKMAEDESPALEAFADYLYTVNESLYNKIMGFFETYGNLSALHYDKLNKFMFNITNWNLLYQSDSHYDDELYTITQYMQNAVQFMSKVYPTILLNGAEFNTVPAHWGFSKKDPTYKKIQTFIEKHYADISKFKNDKIMNRLLQEVMGELVNLNLFTQNIPVITPIQKSGHVFSSLFDKKTTFLIFSYCFYSVINTYVEMSGDIELLHADLEEVKQDRRGQNKLKNDAAAQLSAQLIELDIGLEESEADLQEYVVQVGDSEELKMRLAELLLGYLNIEEKNKKAINFSYDQIIVQVRRSREKEKKSIVEELGRLSKEERKVEDMLKNFKIGRWNVGQQKGLVAYDATTNERETKDMIGQLLQDVDENMNPGDELMMDVYDLNELLDDQKGVNADELDDNEPENYDGEGEDINQFADGYLDGTYYEEDREDDFPED